MAGANTALGAIEGSKINLLANKESTNDLSLFKQIDSHEMSV